MTELKGKSKIVITFSILFATILILLLFIFFVGKKTYVVQFDLNGGTLISGTLEQHILQGQDATPPLVEKEGAFLRSWDTSYKRITRNVVISAVWEYETTNGIIYSDGENQNFVEIVGAYKYLNGEVYLGAFYDEKKVLGIRENAFFNCTGITKIYLLEGLIHIGEGAFAGCTRLEEIEIPETVTHIEAGAFRGCESLEELTLNEGLVKIGERAFEDCVLLEELILPESVEEIDSAAFAGCESLVIKVKIAEEDVPKGWAEDWFGDAEVVWGYVEEPEEEETTEKNNNNIFDKNNKKEDEE
ncbi:MAG: leucine-rich repeat domain-containing protein [Clostridia bacterium]|nr:leucine-rich repeat domain-containing protein [Clostridia bacterium]